MMFILKVTLLVLPAIISLGCTPNHHAEVDLAVSEQSAIASATTSTDSVADMIIAGIDLTGSAEEMRSMAIREAKCIVTAAMPCQRIIIWAITDSSYLARNEIVNLALGSVPPVKNSLSLPEKVVNARALQKNQSLKNVSLNRLESTRIGPCPKTDIWGFLAAASDRFREGKSGGRRKLCVISDFIDNQHNSSDVDLSGVDVILAQLNVDANPEASLKRRKWLESTLISAGARSVVTQLVSWAKLE